MNKENLLRLADFLDTVPQETFDMGSFMLHNDKNIHIKDVENICHSCGTVACAVGHGPDAGFPILPDDESWDGYSERVFGLLPSYDQWQWCFGANWEGIDNSPSGAAKRIRYLCEKGEVPEWYKTRSYLRRHASDYEGTFS